MATQNTGQYSIESVGTALELLEAFCEVEGELCITHLAQRLGLTKSRVFRLLATFEQKGYVKKSTSQGKYNIGISAFETSRKLLTRLDLLSKAKPVMDALARECSESIYLAIPSGDDILLIEMANTDQQVQVIPLVGRRYPITDIAAGRVIFAHMTLGKTLSGEWATSRDQGFCLDQDKLAEGVTSIAAPIFDARNQAIGSLCLIGPSFRLTEEKIKEFHISHIKHATSLISAKLGCLTEEYL